MKSLNAILEEEFQGTRVGKESSPLTEDQWQIVEDETIEVLRNQTRLTQLARELGLFDDRHEGDWNKTKIKTYRRQQAGGAHRSMDGEPQPVDHMVRDPEFIKAPVLAVDRALPSRGIDDERVSEEASDAADELAQDLEDFLGNGDSAFGVESLIQPSGIDTAVGNSWSTSESNITGDIQDMLDGLDDDGISASNQQIVLALAQQQWAEVQDRLSNSDSTVRTWIEDNYEVDRVVKLDDFLADGTAVMFAAERQHMRVYPIADVRSEAWRKGESERSGYRLGTYMALTTKIRHTGAYEERTGLA